MQIRRRRGKVLPKESVLAIGLSVIFLTFTFSACKVSAASTKIAVDPSTTATTIGSSFSVDLNVTDIINFTCWQFSLYYLKSILNCTAVTEGPFLKSGGGTFFLKQINNTYDSTYGLALAACTLLKLNVSVNGSGVIATVVFKAVGLGNSPLHLDEIILGDEKIPPQPIPYTAVDGTVQVVPGVGHDVAITDVIPIKSVVGKGYGCNITVVTQNHGGYAETYNITLHANETKIATKLVTVQVSGTATVDFTWNTSNYAFGNYRMWAYAWPVLGETNTANNNFTDGTVTIAHVGDITADGKCDIQDLARVSAAFGSIRVNDPNDPRYGQYWHTVACSTCPHTPNADITNDAKIDIQDLARTSANFGWHE